MPYTDADIAKYIVFARRLAAAARGETLRRFRNGAAVSNKAGEKFDPVTDADREAERVLRDMIAAAYPAHGVVGEEFGVREGEGPWRWVLDPVDGTRAFICGVPSWTTLIALEYEGRPVLSVIDQPYTDECWVGAQRRTYLQRPGCDIPCRTSGVKVLSEARLSTTDPRSSGYFTEGEASAFARLANGTRVARFSMDAYAYALLASGELDIVVETGLKHHDVAALVPVVEGAGGVITNWSGGAPGDDGEALAAATPALHEAAMKALKS